MNPLELGTYCDESTGSWYAFYRYFHEPDFMHTGPAHTDEAHARVDMENMYQHMRELRVENIYIGRLEYANA